MTHWINKGYSGCCAPFTGYPGSRPLHNSSIQTGKLSSWLRHRPHLVQSCLWNREVDDAQILVVVAQHIEHTSQAAGVWWQLVLQHVLVTLLQLDAGESILHVGADGTRVRVKVSVIQPEDDGVAVTKPGRWRAERNNSKNVYVVLHQYSWNLISVALKKETQHTIQEEEPQDFLLCIE